MSRSASTLRLNSVVRRVGAIGSVLLYLTFIDGAGIWSLRFKGRPTVLRHHLSQAVVDSYFVGYSFDHEIVSSVSPKVHQTPHVTYGAKGQLHSHHYKDLVWTNIAGQGSLGLGSSFNSNEKWDTVDVGVELECPAKITLP